LSAIFDESIETDLRCRLLLYFFTVFLAEFLNPACGIDNFLLARIEGMTDRTYFDMQGLAHGGTGLERIAATAAYGEFLIIGVNFWFHEIILELLLAACWTGKAHIIL
jgi:hypothetical protein